MPHANRGSIIGYARQAAGVLIGSLLFAIGLSWFLVPYRIAPGGVGGLSQVMFHLFGWNLGVTMIVLNIPLWIWGVTMVGRQFGIGTFIGFFVSSAMADLVAPRSLHRLGILTEFIERRNTVDGVLRSTAEWAMTDQVFLAAIAGSMLLGVGIGIMFKSRSSTGGTDIPVAFLKKRFGVSIGNGYLIIETVIIVCVGLIFADLDIVIWSYFGLFLSSKFVDLVTEGISRVKSATIVCSSPDAERRIRDRIYSQLDRGCTFLKGQGTWSGTEKNIIFVAFNLQQVATLTALVREEDPEVFMIMNDVHDAIGFGFKSRQIDFGK